MKRDPTYCSGESIHEGDTVRIGSLDGIVEAIITSQSPGWADYWSEHGEGVMLAGPVFGKLHAKFHDEDLVLVRRKQA